MMPTIQSWSEAFMTSLAAAMAMFMAAIPKLIGFAVILLAGWFIASLAERAVAALLRKVRFNEFACQSGFSDFIEKTGVRQDCAGFVAFLAKWAVRLIALVVAFDALGLPAVSNVLRELLLWLPNLAVALAVLVIGGLAANAVGSLVRGATAEAQLGNANFLATVARVAIWAFAIIVAVNQIGVADEIVNTLFMGVVAILVLALGLSFGLGGRDTAAKIVSRWYDKAEASRTKIPTAAEAAEQPALTRTTSFEGSRRRTTDTLTPRP
jgi:hypothetical protein